MGCNSLVPRLEFQPGAQLETVDPFVPSDSFKAFAIAYRHLL